MDYIRGHDKRMKMGEKKTENGKKERSADRKIVSQTEFDVKAARKEQKRKDWLAAIFACVCMFVWSRTGFLIVGKPRFERR